MEVYRELEIELPDEVTSSFIKKLEESLCDGWERDLKSEEYFPKVHPGEHYFFKCNDFNWRKSARLLLSRHRRTGKLYVPNIRPANQRKLSRNEYHQILEEFYSNFVEPVCLEMEIPCTLTSREQGLEDWISKSSASKLKSFSDLANRDVPHPYDQERWHDFLITVFPEHHDFSPDRLERWLVEEEKWPEDSASDLMLQYEFAMELLKYQAMISQ